MFLNLEYIEVTSKRGSKPIGVSVCFGFINTRYQTKLCPPDLTTLQFFPIQFNDTLNTCATGKVVAFQGNSFPR